MPAVFTAFCEVKAMDVLDLNAHELANSLRAMANTCKAHACCVHGSPRGKAEDLLDFNAHELANILRAMASKAHACCVHGLLPGNGCGCAGPLRAQTC